MVRNFARRLNLAPIMPCGKRSGGRVNRIVLIVNILLTLVAEITVLLTLVEELRVLLMVSEEIKCLLIKVAEIIIAYSRSSTSVFAV